VYLAYLANSHTTIKIKGVAFGQPLFILWLYIKIYACYNYIKLISDENKGDFYMVGTMEEYIGTRMTWDDIVKYIPDRWVAIRDFNFENGNITDGIVEDIFGDNDVREARRKYRGENYVCVRTTDSYTGGLLCHY
jgi:hypothetical protein